MIGSSGSMIGGIGGNRIYNWIHRFTIPFIVVKHVISINKVMDSKVILSLI
jgi:hypothetical protein